MQEQSLKVFAGVPVIATDWKHNSEMITHFQNGVIYPTEEISSLLDGVEWLVDNEKICFR